MGETGFFPGFDGRVASPLAQLANWEPENWPVAADWKPTLASFLHSEKAQSLGEFIQNRLASGATIYPPQPFRALELTPLASVRVVILGQDPYHGPGQAQGLAFSVASGLRLPPSLRNIFKEIARDIGVDRPGKPPNAALNGKASGSLAGWAKQGVLLLNTCLTVEQGQPASHAKRGWEVLTDEIVKVVWELQQPVVFMLWGAHAQARQSLMTGVGQSRHLVLAANHPSPLSALRPPRPFMGCGHFGVANAFLQERGLKPVAW
jgi:uracil-DNA glycosylase